MLGSAGGDQLDKKRIALFLDGTWNAVGDNTNVWRLKSLCSNGGARARQVHYYDVGVNGFWGGMLGKGLSENVADAYKWLIDTYTPGDDIFIFGFSRGAYTARSLAGLIAKYGLLKPGAPLGVNQIYKRYRRAEDRTIWKLLSSQQDGTLGETTLEERWMLKYSHPTTIKFVGVWDTVGAIGIPVLSISGLSRSTFGFLHTGLRTPIENGFHAVAIDEHRRTFSPTLWTVRKPKDSTVVIAPPRPLNAVEQRWFVGAHANVGGGCESDLLAQLPLKWMMSKAAERGLMFRNSVEDEPDVLRALISDSYSEFIRGAYSKVSARYYRPIAAPPQEDADSTHPTVNETIDRSVFDRWRADSNYRPRNLTEWVSRLGVDPKQLTTSVVANSPQNPVGD